MHLGGHHHGHSHGCEHDHGHVKLNRSFAIAVVLNVLLVIGEALGGVWAGSMALLADAGHNLSDVAGLILAWWAHWLRGKGGSRRWTYGLRSFTILAANLNGILIVVAIVGVTVESTRRLMSPNDVAEIPVLTVALVAALLNFATARLLAGGGDDLNVRGAYLHMLADAAVSMAVVLGAVLMMVTSWHWIDPAISLAICVVLSFGTFSLLRESTSMLLHAAPRQLDVDEVKEFIESTKEVETVQDLHIWSVSTTEVALTAKIACPRCDAETQDELLDELHSGLHEQFAISHATIEIVRHAGDKTRCPLDDEARH